MHLRLAEDGSTFATRPRAQSIVRRLGPLRGTEPLVLDFDRVEAASPAFLDESFGLLAEADSTVSVVGARSDLHPLMDRVIARRGLQSRFKVAAEA